jgi:hypothetical protein
MTLFSQNRDLGSSPNRGILYMPNYIYKFLYGSDTLYWVYRFDINNKQRQIEWLSLDGKWLKYPKYDNNTSEEERQNLIIEFDKKTDFNSKRWLLSVLKSSVGKVKIH